MKQAFRKNIIREIRGSLGRFLAILTIVALGVGFLAGLLSTAPVMRDSVDIYYDDSNLYDLSVQSTLGLVEEDLDALGAIEGVKAVMPFYQKDVTIQSPGGNTLAVRINSLDFSMADTDDGYMDHLALTEGRFPQKADECVLMEKALISGEQLRVGDILSVAPENGDVSDALSTVSFTVVGLVNDACYFSIEHETTTVGSGTLQDILYTTADAFTYSVYTNAYVTVENADMLNAFGQEYLDLMDTVAVRIEKTGSQRSTQRYNDIVNDAQQKLDTAQAAYDTQKAAAEKQLADALNAIDEGQAAYDAGVQELADGKAAYESGLLEYESGKEQLAQTKVTTEKQLADAQSKIEAGEEELLSSKETLDEARGLVELVRKIMSLLKNKDRDALQQLLDQWEQDYDLPELNDRLRKAVAWLDEKNNEAVETLLTELHTKYDDRIAEYDNGLSAYEKGVLTLNASKDELTAAKITWAVEETKATLKLEQAAAELANAKEVIDSGNTELTQAAAKLEQARTDYDSGKVTAETQLADAQKQIRDAQNKLNDFSKPQWYVFTRNSNVSYKSFSENADKMEAIARVFPLFFFLVAALVALTTMTRMVEEQRVQIGTLKALGYSKGMILSKYLIYAGAATLVGCVVGLMVGLTILPSVIYHIYGIMYTLPAIQLECRWEYVLLSAGAAIACTMLATFSAVSSTLKEVPATLMLPKAPKAGKRILLERIQPLWKHLKFIHKVTARNLFRYKKRLFMTIFGIAGCTALLVTGFGLKDSIGGICDKQFEELQNYNLSVYCSDISDELLTAVSGDEAIQKSMTAFQQSMTAADAADQSKSRQTVSAYLFVPQETAQLPEFITMRTRKTHEAVPFTTDGAVITEKMAETLGLSIGDSLQLTDQDNHSYQVPVSGIMENYVYSYIYMPRELYDQLLQQAYTPNTLLADIPADKDVRDTVGAQILSFDGVHSIQFTEDISDSFGNIISSIDAIVYVLIISAAALAFVVLYNLTNINITERQRELATLKVLGFFNRETASYIFREIILLSVIGTACGLLFGIFLHAYIIRTVEIDMVMFGRDIGWLSYLLAAVLTLVFSLLVDLVMYPKLKRIDMVESLKSVD